MGGLDPKLLRRVRDRVRARFGSRTRIPRTEFLDALAEVLSEDAARLQPLLQHHLVIWIEDGRTPVAQVLSRRMRGRIDA